MGICIEEIAYFAEAGFLGKRVLDLGAQHVHHATVELLRPLAGPKTNAAAIAEIAAQNPLFSATVYQMMGLEYASYDVAPGPNTMLLDFNGDVTPRSHRNYFDFVTNSGTTEHIINQLNCFRISHEVLRVGGLAYHHVPSSGYHDHGYYLYHEQFFRDLAAANGYDIHDLWYVYRGDLRFDPSTVDVRAQRLPGMPHSDTTAKQLPTAPSFTIAVLLRKTKNEPFQLPLELRTAASSLADDMKWRYSARGQSRLRKIRTLLKDIFR